MSSLVGFRSLANFKRFIPLSVKAVRFRNISTSKKNSDTANISNEVCDDELFKENKDKNWISYGFSEKSYEEDRHFAHMTVFMGVTVIFVFGTFIMYYRPDGRLSDWSQREAFLELRRREKLGLPLIDPNFIPLDKIKLPSDEELGDTEIVI